MIYAAISLFATASVASAKVHPGDHKALEYMFKQFKEEFGKRYDVVEDAKRFKIFSDNLHKADERNALEGSVVHGITKFSDLSQEEFADMMLGSVPPSTPSEAKVLDNVEAASNTYKDWAGVLTTPVKNQAQCGSCWAFSATEQIESDYMRIFGETLVLSPEQIVECDNAAFGCGGGWTESAYGYVKKAGGIETEEDYPYTSQTGKTGRCQADARKEVASLSSFTTINGETNMANYVLSTGPLSVCVDANNWNSYTGGILTRCGQQIDHCVQAVGVDTSKNGYWKVRNSWGVTWGESGYIRLAYGENTCGITNDPTFVDAIKV